MTNGEKATKTRDEHYNLVSVLYHALQGGETYDQYIQDAREAGDDELVQYFQDVQEQDRQRAERAKKLLHGRLA
ncbi:MAG: hypothetical protein M3198_05220 [Actinomycetota bacterium]|nr:hypothetical protein [Actinomycetota bacterium]